jgi:hypothetical protein
MDTTREMTGDSCNKDERKHKVLLPFGAPNLAQAYPPSCPQEKPQSGGEERRRKDDALGDPLSIREVADLIGCSVWTVRQRYLRAGIPFVRLRPYGKLIFYKNQIIHWLLDEQQKGGSIP